MRGQRTKSGLYVWPEATARLDVFGKKKKKSFPSPREAPEGCMFTHPPSSKLTTADRRPHRHWWFHLQHDGVGGGVDFMVSKSLSLTGMMFSIPFKFL